MPAPITARSRVVALVTLAAVTALVGCTAATEPVPRTSDVASPSPTAPRGDADRIAFGRWDTGADLDRPPALWTANADGSDPRPVGNQHGWYMEWSPDRTHLVFDLPDDQGNEHIATVQPDGSDFVQLTSGTGFFGDPTYSPDGATIVFSHSPVRENEDGFAAQLWVMDADGGNMHALLAPEDVGSDWEPVFSPDGTHIAFTREVTRSGVAVSAIHLANADGTDVHPITEFDDYIEHPRWSPDGTTIICNIETRQAGFNDPRNGIWTIPASGGEPRQLLPSDERYHAFKPNYSPDGSQILFGCANPDGTNEDLCVMNSDGTDIRSIFQTQEYENHGVW